MPNRLVNVILGSVRTKSLLERYHPRCGRKLAKKGTPDPDADGNLPKMEVQKWPKSAFLDRTLLSIKGGPARRHDEGYRPRQGADDVSDASVREYR